MNNKGVSPCLIPVGKSNRKEIHPGSYFQMFLMDFCTLSSLSTRYDGHHESFEVSDEQLRNTLITGDTYCNDNSISLLINKVASTLVRKGRAYIEVKTKYGKGKTLKEIQFNDINILRVSKRKENYRCKTLSFTGKTEQRIIPKDSLIVFDLTELGFKRKYFIRLFRKIQKNEFPYGMIDNKDFDLSLFQSISEKKLLKLNRQTYWNGRNNSNQYLSEAYLLFRTMKFRELQWTFLQYILDGLNKSIATIGKENGISGNIRVRERKPDYDEMIAQMSGGELNFDQVSEMVFHNK